MTLNPWSLATPLDVIAAALIALARLVWWTLETPTRNVNQLGWAWVPCYWALVYGCGLLGAWGSARMRTIRRGADFFEFDPNRRGGQWAGRLAVNTIRLQVAGEAWAATAAVLAGYGGLVVLLTVGIVWRWLPVILVGVAWWYWRARTRNPWWENADG